MFDGGGKTEGIAAVLGIDGDNEVLGVHGVEGGLGGVIHCAEGEQVEALGGGEARGSGDVGSSVGAVVQGAETLDP